MALCSTIKCLVFSGSRDSSSSSGGQRKAMAIAYVVLGASVASLTTHRKILHIWHWDFRLMDGLWHQYYLHMQGTSIQTLLTFKISLQSSRFPQAFRTSVVLVNPLPIPLFLYFILLFLFLNVLLLFLVYECMCMLCMCVCACVMWCVYEGRYANACVWWSEDNFQELVLSFYLILRQGLSKAGQELLRDSSVSSSHITVGVLGLQMHTTTSAFYLGSGDPNLGLQAIQKILYSLTQSPGPPFFFFYWKSQKNLTSFFIFTLNMGQCAKINFSKDSNKTINNSTQTPYRCWSFF